MQNGVVFARTQPAMTATREGPLKTDTYITIFVGMMVNAVLFGIGAVTVMSIPGLEPYWKYLIPAVVVLSFVLAPFIARPIAPRLRLRNRRKPIRA